MTVQERLQLIASALPSDASAVTFTRADLQALIEEERLTGATVEITRDLTVAEVADVVGRNASTVRGWLIDGKLRGYKLNGRDWRIPRAALQEYLDGQAASVKEPSPETREVDITAWRRVRGA